LGNIFNDEYIHSGRRCLALLEVAMASDITIRCFEHGQDYDLLTAIDAHSYDEYWTREEFKNELKKQSVVCRIAEQDGLPKGFVLYEMYLNRLYILRIGVHPKYRLQGIGKALLGAVEQKTTKERTLIFAEVRESNLGLQLFLKKANYRAEEVMKNYYPDNGEDSYVFNHKVSFLESPDL
jgi:ribosomal-protein-alanine N-acetyltransferase